MTFFIKILDWCARPWVYWAFFGALVVLLYVLIVGITIPVTIDTVQLKRFRGHAIYLSVPQPLGMFYAPGDTSEAQERSKLTLYENDQALGPAHALHEGIRTRGAGAYLHWRGELTFSTSDNSDVRTNGRRYWYYANFLPRQPLLDWLLTIAWVLGGVVVAGTAVRVYRHKMPLKPVGGAALLGFGCARLLPETKGVPFVSLLAVAGIAWIFVAASIGCAILSARSYRRGSKVLVDVMVVLGSLTFAATAGEGVLQFLARTDPGTEPMRAATAIVAGGATQAGLRSEARQRALARQRHISMPKEWEKRPVDVPGAFEAYYWHGALHVHNRDGMRRINGFREKDSSRFRIMVVGDSLTYGVGVERAWSYPALLQRKLEARYIVEVLNLGVPGRQSEDIVEIVKHFYDALRPDLVVYGICVNDFLDSGERIYAKPLLKVPKFVKVRSNLSKFVEDKVNGAARRLGLSLDFYDDILKDVSNYRKRFVEDLAAMNSFVRGRGGPPVMAIVLDAHPDFYGRSYRIARIAESAAVASGMQLVEVEKFHREFDGQNFRVSPWEGHPNEIAHDIFSDMLADVISRSRAIRPYAAVTGAAKKQSDH